jgi:hypothetical protein
VQGEQVIAIAAFVETYVLDYEVSYRAAEPGFAERSAYAEIALALGIAERTSDARVATACELVERLPATVAAMRAGQVTLPRARVLLEETVHLNSEQRLVVEGTLLPKAPALTPGNLRRSTRRLVEKIDAEALLKRTAAAKADRWVRLWELPDGMAELCAQLPAQDVAAISGSSTNSLTQPRHPTTPAPSSRSAPTLSWTRSCAPRISPSGSGTPSTSQSPRTCWSAPPVLTRSSKQPPV